MNAEDDNSGNKNQTIGKEIRFPNKTANRIFLGILAIKIKIKATNSSAISVWIKATENKDGINGETDF